MSLLEGRGLICPSPFGYEILRNPILCRSYASNYSCSEFMCVSALSLLFITVLPILWLFQYFCPFFWILSLRVGDCNVDILLGPEHSMVSCTLHFGQLRISVLTAVHCMNKLIWLGLRTAQIYEYKDKYSESSLIIISLNKIIVESYPSEPMTFSNHGL